jgi:hypothetical protein
MRPRAAAGESQKSSAYPFQYATASFSSDLAPDPEEGIQAGTDLLAADRWRARQ